METITVSVKIQFDKFNAGNSKHYAITTLDQFTKVLQERFNDISPLIFSGMVKSSDIEVEDLENENEILARGYF